MQKNDTFIGTCSGYTNEGLGIVKHDNVVFFVKNILREEEAKIVVTQMKKTYGYARALEILKVSEHRVEPKCSVYKQCGGCQLQIMDADEQQYFKTNKVRDCFHSIAQMDISIDPCKMMEEGWRYRNKVQVPVQVDKGVHVGFYQNHTNHIVEFEDCLVQTKLSNEIVQFTKKVLIQDSIKTIKHILIKHEHITGEVMVVLVSTEKKVNYSALVSKLVQQFKEIKSIILNYNPKDTNVVLGEEEKVLYGSPTVQEELLGCTFNISSKSFYQINPSQTQVLYSIALDYANITKEDTVIDLYCGTGTIGILASKYAKKVVGIEIVKEAIEDAKKNAALNHVENIEFVCADAKKGAQEFLHKSIDVIIVDPPRKGCDQDTLDAIDTMNPKRLVYVSCDPATLARDVKKMAEKGWAVEKIQPVDLFPSTVHVETVVLMVRKDK